MSSVQSQFETLVPLVGWLINDRPMLRWVSIMALETAKLCKLEHFRIKEAGIAHLWRALTIRGIKDFVCMDRQQGQTAPKVSFINSTTNREQFHAIS